ncbi:MAG TPA: ribonuclease HIII [Bacteroidetes bacterium]|nr:ribonuclease HIII [Bacteroidota bacterium]HEX05073.1 ribonuclease HIII [Bacteroidota bacterium]
MVKLTDPVLVHLTDQLQKFADEKGFLLSLDPIQYGVKLCLSDPNLPDDKGKPGTARGVLYHSVKKKRVSWVPEGKSDSVLGPMLNEHVQALVGAREEKSSSTKDRSIGATERNLKCWVGTDETGKGDLFGPLIIGGFVADRQIAKALKEMGVRDSKELKRGQIERLATQIYTKWEDRCHIVMISVKRYNEMYPGFERKGGINGLLGWGHGTAIKDAVSGSHPIEGAVVDKFGGEHRLKPYMKGVDVPLILRSRAESNMAVAAGAILARAKYEWAMDAMEKPLGFRPHAGAGSPAMVDLKRLAKEKPDDMALYVKMHFKPVQAVKLLS